MAELDLVSREELDAHLAPMRDDITEIKGDVKALLLANAAEAALRGRRVRRQELSALWRPTLIASVLSVGAGVVLHFV